MADLTYKFTGVNTAQLANEVQRLRRNSSTFQALETAAVAAGYTTIEIEMGAGLLPGDIADSTKTNSFTRTIRINSDATGSWGVGGRQATVGEVIAHELAHAVVPSQYERHATIDPQERDSEGMWVRRQAGRVAIEAGGKPMSDAECARTSLGFLKKMLTTIALVGLLGIVSLGSGVCQTPGYGEKPDEWAPYERGRYFDQLQEIVKTYEFADGRITYLHFETTAAGIGPVELFRLPGARSRDCGGNGCHFFVLVASDHSGTHLFNPDRSRFFGFEFSCPATLLQVKVTPTHLMAITAEKMPENGK
jgi:hypothetical protein